MPDAYCSFWCSSCWKGPAGSKEGRLPVLWQGQGQCCTSTSTCYRCCPPVCGGLTAPIRYGTPATAPVRGGRTTPVCGCRSTHVCSSSTTAPICAGPCACAGARAPSPCASAQPCASAHPCAQPYPSPNTCASSCHGWQRSPPQEPWVLRQGSLGTRLLKSQAEHQRLVHRFSKLSTHTDRADIM